MRKGTAACTHSGDGEIIRENFFGGEPRSRETPIMYCTLPNKSSNVGLVEIIGPITAPFPEIALKLGTLIEVIGK